MVVLSGAKLHTCGPSERDPHEIAASGNVALVREPGPTGDAVAVVFDGHRVGYLSKRDAAKIAPAFDRMIPAGHVAVTGARIMCHHDHHPERMQPGSQYVIEEALPEFTGVVRVAPPDEWFPTNQPPAGEQYWLELDAAAALVGTDDHQDHLGRLAGAGRAPYFWCTLNARVSPRGRIDVDVLVEGIPIGRLGPTLTKQVGQMVVDRTSEGMVVVAHAHPAKAKNGTGAYLSSAH